MKMYRKFLAILLVIIMMIGMMPTASAMNLWCPDDGLEHNWGPWRGELDIPCGEEGYIWRECRRCGAGDEKLIYKEHVPGPWQYEEDYPPTCTEWGVKSQYCTVCGECCGQDEVEPLGHKWGSWEWAHGEPTCKEGAWKVRNCKRCGAMEDKWAPAGEHKWGPWETKTVGTCVKPGSEVRECTICGETQSRENEYGDHAWGSWQVIEQGDCTHPGKEKRTCTICGATQTRDTEEGSHKWGSWRTKKEATCTEDGREERKCSLCGKTQTREHDKLGHNFGEWKVIQEPNYPEPGIRERKCSRCGLTEREEFYPDGTHMNGDRDDETVKKVQEELNNNGYDCGKPDGDFGPNTENAWTKWQEDNGYTPDGIMWPGQVDELLGGEDGGEAKLAVYLTVLNGPANGSYYVLGEHVDFDITIENISNVPIFDIDVSFVDDEGPKVWANWNLEPGESEVFNGGHTFDEIDIANGFYSGYAYAAGVTEDGKEVTAESDAIRLPCGADENADLQHKTSFSMEFTQPLPALLENVKAGDVVELPMRITNTGTTTFNVSDKYIRDVDGQFVGLDEYPDWYWGHKLTPGGYAEDNYPLTITEKDIASGIAVRTYEQHVYACYYTGTNLLYGIDPKPEGHDGSVEYHFEDNGVDRAMQSIQFGIPLTAGSAPDFQYVTVEKSIISTPANGEYYTQGEGISFQIKVIIPEGKTITDLEITDPLKGGNEDAILDILPTATSADNTEYVFNYVVTAEDVERGYVENSACAYFFDPEGDAWVEEWSNTVVAPTSGEITDDSIILTKAIVGEPKDGTCYRIGEEITFAVTITNVSDETFYDVIVYDPILEFAELKPYDVVEPGFSDTIRFSYIVTDDDAAAGYVENTAFIVRPNGADFNDRIYSNKVTALCGKPVFIVGTIVLTGILNVAKTEVSAPANGQFYLPGETVTYQIDVTNTHPTMAMLDVVVTDPLMTELGGNWESQSIDPGATETFTYNYVVTPIDAIAGSVTNIATAEGVIATGDPLNPKGAKYVGISDKVTVLTGMPEDFPFGVITEMTIVKEETSTPANGSYYTEGETISYKITYTNTGETEFGETLIYDTLKMDSEIASAEKLTSGESRFCTFSYVVTAEDVEKGYVVNAAIAKYDIGNGYINTAISEPVISDTDGDPNTTYVPGSGTIDWDEIRDSEGTDENGNPLPAADTCYIKAVSRDGDSVEYEVHFCTEHAKIHDELLTMENDAGDNMVRRQMALNYAFILWQKEIDGMYEKILAACDDAAKITVMNERVTHLTMVANTQFALKIAEPSQHMETLRAVVELWKNKCIDLCYLMNTAPSDRIDSIFAVERAQNEAEVRETCTCEITEETADKILFADLYCPTHGLTYMMAELLLLNDDSEEAWATVRTLWEIDLQRLYNQMYEDASEEGGMAYLVEYSAYLQWMSAYEQIMDMAYTKSAETVAEVMVNAFMGRALDVCGRVK
ncbi:MAG: peptidoglycan-binding protein [Clostridia bacterium]|nr:peptidoglycan-binding protein [Clostridia bacterium]